MKRFFRSLGMMLALSLLFACSSGEQSGGKSSGRSFLSIGTAPPGGAFFVVGGAIGEVLSALDQPREARNAFERAIEKDRVRLAEASNATAKAKVHWSLGKTFVALGDPEAANESLARAVALPSNAKTRYRLSAWIQDNLDEDTYSALIASVH